MPLLVIGLSHRTSPVELRERFAFKEEAIPQLLRDLKASGLAEEAVILSTCNRVEIYASSRLPEAQAAAAIRSFFIGSGSAASPPGDAVYTLASPQSVEHLFRVAAGLDSMALGETEILGQVKKAYDLALRHRHTGGRLNKIFQKAFNVAKEIRTHTSIQRGSVSVASVAVELAERIFSSLEGRHVLVLGAGDTGEKAARALASRGARQIFVANRNQERAETLAQALNGKALPFDDWGAAAEQIDIVISSTAAPHYVLDRAKVTPLMRLRKNRPLLLIDIAVPRDIDPEVAFIENIYLYNIDDLQGIANDYLQQRREEIARCDGIIRERAQALLVHLTPREPPPSAELAFGSAGSKSK